MTRRSFLLSLPFAVVAAKVATTDIHPPEFNPAPNPAIEKWLRESCGVGAPGDAADWSRQAIVRNLTQKTRLSGYQDLERIARDPAAYATEYLNSKPRRQCKTAPKRGRRYRQASRRA